MNHKEITNQSIFAKDWAAADRKKFLKSISKPKMHKDKMIAPGVMARSVWNQDVSGMDRRSVKAMLVGKGDGRATWWNIFNGVIVFFKPSSTLEQRMYTFHKMHHALTFFRLSLIQDYKAKQKEIKEKLVDLRA